MDVTYSKLKKPEMTSFLQLLFDKWSLVGFSGMLLSIFSLMEGAELPDVTGFSGVIIVGAAVYQKVRDDRRKQQKHNRQMLLIDKMLNGEIKIDVSIVREFMEVKK